MSEPRFSSVTIFCVLIVLFLSACATVVPIAGAPSSQGPPTEVAPPTTTVPSGDGTPPSAAPRDDLPPVPYTGGLLAGTAWLLESMSGESPLESDPITLRVTTFGMASGSSGCNYYSGGFTEGEGTFRVESLGSTLMGCTSDPLREQENSYLELIQVTSRYVVEQERLKLSDDSGVEMLVFLPQSQELAGSTWIVESYNDGDSPGRGVIENSIAKVLFTEDGSISGGAGCNSFTGKYTARDGVLAIEQLAITELGCLEPAGVMEQETALVEAMESAVGYWVDGNRLHLKTDDGTAAAEFIRG